MKKVFFSVFGFLLAANLLAGNLPLADDLLIVTDLMSVEELTSTNDNIVVEDISSKFHVGSSQFTLITSPDNSVLIFYANSEENKQLVLFYTLFNKDTKQWSSPSEIKNDFNVIGERNSQVITKDRKEYFITKGKKNKNIYSVRYEYNEWLEPKKLNSNINTSANESNAYLSHDGLTMYFASDRDGGYGGTDIYASERLSDGRWSKAYNLGAEVNTKEDEASPYILFDDVTLYFSSKGHNSKGGYDIFTATLTNGNWGQTDNIGAPINTKNDDMFFILSSDEKYAYYSSASADESGQFKIYKITYK